MKKGIGRDVVIAILSGVGGFLGMSIIKSIATIICFFIYGYIPDWSIYHWMM